MLFKVLVRMDIELKSIKTSQLPISFGGWGYVEGHHGGKIDLLMMTGKWDFKS